MKNKHTKENRLLMISHTETDGYRRSLADSPEWNTAFGVIESLIKKFNLKTMVEIGVARGHHSAHLLEAITDLHVYSVDPWGYFADEYDNMYNYHSLDDDEKLYSKVVNLLRPFGERSTILRTTSMRATRLITKPVDLVYLDGDHSYEGIKKDMAHWWNKLKMGGILSGNAYGHIIHPGVARAVNEFVASKGLKLNLEIGRVWWIMKPPKEEIESSTNKNQVNPDLKPPLCSRLKRITRRSLLMSSLKTKALARKIPGAKFVLKKINNIPKIWK